jgi:hypothetical protein
MHPERVVIARVSAVIVAAVVVAAIVGAFGSLLLGHLFPAAAHELRLRSSE